MSATHVIPFPTEGEGHITPEPALPPVADVLLPHEEQLVTTVVVTPAQGETTVPHLRTRYPGAFASFARWAAAERVGEDLIIR